MVGTYAIQQNEKKPRIFMRDRYEDKKTNITENANIIPTSLEVIMRN
jgi:hypothetical protein